jgi:hypothetical protein
MELLGDGYVSVTDTTNQIVTILRDCRHVNGLMIYWVHAHNRFEFHLPGDQKYNVEMKYLRNELRDPNGNVLEIVAGEPLQVGFDTLYPIDVKFLSHPCYPYVLLRQDGMMDHSEFTPYFVRTIEKRDAILQWLNRI